MSSTSRITAYYPYEILSKKKTEASLLLFVQDPMTRQPLVMKILLPYKDTRYNRGTLSERQMCQLQALDWNRKFTPEVYIGLAYLYKQDDRQICISKIVREPSKEEMRDDVEYVLLMERLPEDRCLDTLLDKLSKTTFAQFELLTRHIAQLHMDLNPLADIQWGSLDHLQRKLEHNIELFNLMLEKDIANRYVNYRNIPDTLTSVFKHKQYRKYFEQRFREHRIKHCHGDLKLSNIWLIPTDHSEAHQRILLLDAIDFNPIYSNIAILSDFAMLLVDVQAHTLSSTLVGEMIEHYLQLTDQGSEINRSVLNYYLVERARECAAVSIFDYSHLGQNYLEVAQMHLNELKYRLNS